MNRTTLFLAAAGALCGIAVLLAPKLAPQAPAQPPAPTALPSVRAPLAVTTSGKAVSVEARLSHESVERNGATYLHLGLTGRSLQEQPRAVSLVLVLDVSGSMAGEKLYRTKEAARLLVHNLSDQDEVGLVSFSSTAQSLALAKATPQTKTQALHFINALQVAGGTNISAGLDTGKTILATGSGVRRLVLLSDGQPTEGDIDSPRLTALAGRIHEEGSAVTALGVGADFATGIMRGMAEAGGGFYGSLESAAALTEVLAQELAYARGAAASKVVVALHAQPGAVVEEVAGRVIERLADGTVRVQVADLAGGSVEKLTIRIKAPNQASGVVQLASAEVSWVENDGAFGRAAVNDTTVTMVESVAESRRDEALFASGLKASGGAMMVLASEAVEQGDSIKAAFMLDNIRGLFSSSADALAGETEVVGNSLARVRAGNVGAAEGKAISKRGLRDFSERNVY